MKKIRIKSTRFNWFLLTIFLLLTGGFSSDNTWPEKGGRKELKKELENIWSSMTPNIIRLSGIQFDSSNQHKALYKISRGNKTLGYAYIARVKTCRSGGCSNPSANSGGRNFEYFDYLLIFNREIGVRQISIFNYNATYGFQITSKSWLRQFFGYHGKHPLKYGHDIHAVSGATISANAIIQDIQNTTRTLKKLKQSDQI